MNIRQQTKCSLAQRPFYRCGEILLTFFLFCISFLVLPSLLNYWGKKKNELHKTMSLPNANKNYWLDALEKSKFVEDPWQKYDIIGRVLMTNFFYNKEAKVVFQKQLINI